MAKKKGNNYVVDTENNRAKSKIDITKQDIRCCDDFYMDNNGIINIPYELWFDVDDYFGTYTDGANNWLNFYTYYYPDGTIKAICEIDYDTTNTESYEWDLTELEQDFFRNKMEEYCQRICGCTIKQLIRELSTR